MGVCAVERALAGVCVCGEGRDEGDSSCRCRRVVHVRRLTSGKRAVLDRFGSVCEKNHTGAGQSTAAAQRPRCSYEAAHAQLFFDMRAHRRRPPWLGARGVRIPLRPYRVHTARTTDRTRWREGGRERGRRWTRCTGSRIRTQSLRGTRARGGGGRGTEEAPSLGRSSRARARAHTTTGCAVASLQEGNDDLAGFTTWR